MIKNTSFHDKLYTSIKINYEKNLPSKDEQYNKFKELLSDEI